MAKKIYLVCANYNQDGEQEFVSEPHETLDGAKKAAKEWWEDSITSGHFEDAKTFIDGDGDMDECDYAWEIDEKLPFYFINDLYDDYWVEISIRESELKD